MFQNVIVGWFARRALELGGIFGVLWTIYSNLSPASQDAIERLFTGRWQEVTLGALVPIGIALWGYIWSFLSTKRPQVVTADSKQIPIKPDTRAANEIEAKAAVAPRPRTLWDRIRGR